MKLKTIGKGIDVFNDYEMRGSFFVEGAKDQEEALEHLEKYLVLDGPDYIGHFKPEDAELHEMAMCLDCRSWWVHDDCICGECGEDRLSKKYKEVYWFNKK